MRAISGSTSAAVRSHRAARRRGARGPSVSILVSSSRTRSCVTWWICGLVRGWPRPQVRSVLEARGKPHRGHHRSLSSAKRRAGSPMARTIPASRSARPPTKSRIGSVAELSAKGSATPVDSEIAPLYILARILGKPHFIRMSTIRISEVASKRSNFDRLPQRYSILQR